MLFYKIPINEEQEVNVTELPAPTTMKEKVGMIVLVIQQITGNYQILKVFEMKCKFQESYS